jgi:hypothetical protein
VELVKRKEREEEELWEGEAVQEEEMMVLVLVLVLVLVAADVVVALPASAVVELVASFSLSAFLVVQTCHHCKIFQTIRRASLAKSAWLKNLNQSLDQESEGSPKFLPERAQHRDSVERVQGLGDNLRQ